MPVPNFVKQLREKIGHDLLLLPGVSAIVTNDAGHVLLQRRSDFGTWAVIGGMIEPGEEPANAIVREVFEETAVRVEPIRITGVYTSPLITYPNGDRAQYVITVFHCRALGGEPRVNDDESLEVKYFSPHELPELRADHKLRIQQAMTTNHEAYFQR